MQLGRMSRRWSEDKSGAGRMLLLALLLLFAQLLAFVHALDHLQLDGDAERAPDVVCSWCVGHAQTGHGLPATPPRLPTLAAASATLPSPALPALRALHFSVYHSQAPPLFPQA